MRYIKNFLIRLGLLIAILLWFVCLIIVVLVIAPIAWLIAGYNLWNKYLQIEEYLESGFNNKEYFK